eukprot:CAMPEP_0174853762 /NCGR_PEP_ID=MMETSP1114-20130205/29558_1 /TAXON_ID=312471 /ORGANISM="Neobodo designis, Strain CCAP 1951/1" /LENGTH=269 /DNA_ID=CAMNT_0016088429 /DNA_START=63 /DNA_END=872 /DNA_ORIENTATION=+
MSAPMLTGFVSPLTDVTGGSATPRRSVAERLLDVQVDAELVEVTVELALDLRERVGRTLVRRGLVGPVRVHDEPRAVVDVEPLLAHGALVLAVALHHHDVHGLGDVRGAVTEARDELVVTRVAERLDTDRAVLRTDGGLVQVVDRHVRLVVPLGAVVLLHDDGGAVVESVPRAGRVLVQRTRRAGHLVVVQHVVLVKHLAHDGVVLEHRQVVLVVGEVVRHVRVRLVFVALDRTTDVVHRRVAVAGVAAADDPRGRERADQAATEHRYQ